MSNPDINYNIFGIDLQLLKSFNFITKEEKNTITIGIYDENEKGNFQPFCIVFKDKLENHKQVVNLFKNSIELLNLADIYLKKLSKEGNKGLEFVEAIEVLKKIQ